MSEELTFTIPNAYWFTSNDRLNHMAEHRKKRWLRSAGATSALAARIGPYRVVHVAAFIGYPTNSIADPSNTVGTVLKALIDGCKDAGLFVDDDSKHLLGPDPRRETGKSPKGTHTVRLVFTNQVHAFGGGA